MNELAIDYANKMVAFAVAQEQARRSGLREDATHERVMRDAMYEAQNALWDATQTEAMKEFA
jgi:hypothetical protein